jgi:hypothetical protein
MNWSYISQNDNNKHNNHNEHNEHNNHNNDNDNDNDKVVEKIIPYIKKLQICPKKCKCGSEYFFPIMNMIGSPVECYKCRKRYKSKS